MLDPPPSHSICLDKILMLYYLLRHYCYQRVCLYIWFYIVLLYNVSTEVWVFWTKGPSSSIPPFRPGRVLGVQPVVWRCSSLYLLGWPLNTNKFLCGVLHIECDVKLVRVIKLFIYTFFLLLFNFYELRLSDIYITRGNFKNWNSFCDVVRFIYVWRNVCRRRIY